MSISPVMTPGTRGLESGRGNALSQLPPGTQLSAQITQRLEGNVLRLATIYGPVTVKADVGAASRLPLSGSLQLSVAGHEEGGTQFNVLPRDGKPPRGPLPVLREVAQPPGGRSTASGSAQPPSVPGGHGGQGASPQTAATSVPVNARSVPQGQASAPQTVAVPIASAAPPVLTTGVPLPATVVEIPRSGGQPALQQLLTSGGTLKTDTPLPFPPGTRVVIALQPGGQEVRITPLAPQPVGGTTPGSAQASVPQTAYQATAGQGSGEQLQTGRAVTIAVTQLKALPPAPPPQPVAIADIKQAQIAASQTQGGAAPLFQSLSAVAQAGQPASNTVAALAAQILGLRLDGTKRISAGDLRTAIRSSGVSNEASLARGQAGDAAGDLKGLLSRLVLGLKREGVRATPPQPGTTRILPPQRGVMFEASSGQNLRMAAGGELPRPGDILQQAEEALSRLRLLQLSGLPDGAERTGEAARREMQLEIPIRLEDGTSVLQLHVEADGRKGTEDDGGGQAWQLHLSLNLGEQGPVNARINLEGGRTGVLLWADDRELRHQIRDRITRLEVDLKELGLDVASVECRKFPLPNKGGRTPGQLINEMS